MAKINKQDAVKNMVGLEGLAAGAALAQGPDNVPAVIQDKAGQPVSPATIKEGEFIFSVEAVIAVGEGDHARGVQILNQIHDQLRMKGQEMLSSQGLGSAPA